MPNDTSMTEAQITEAALAQYKKVKERQGWVRYEDEAALKSARVPEGTVCYIPVSDGRMKTTAHAD